jgi:hypothetical protein
VNPDKLRHEIASSFTVVKDRSTDDEICILCPVPGCEDKSGNRHINVKTLYTHCWRCGPKQPRHVKSLFQLVGLDFNDDHVLDPAELREMLRGTTKWVRTPVQNLALPEGFTLLSRDRRSCYWKFCAEMAERKNLSIEDLEEAQAGFTREGDWEPYCIFPVIEEPRIVYYQGRLYSDDGADRTKKFPSKKVVQYGMSYWVYNLDALETKTATLGVAVESILNVLSLRKRLKELDLDKEIIPVCVFTHRISRSQVAKMMRYPHIKEWCFLFDSDSTELANETAKNLSALLPTSVAEMPQGRYPDGTLRKTNDANDDVDAALLAIHNRKAPNFNQIKPITVHNPDDGRSGWWEKK